MPCRYAAGAGGADVPHPLRRRLAQVLDVHPGEQLARLDLEPAVTLRSESFNNCCRCALHPALPMTVHHTRVHEINTQVRHAPTGGGLPGDAARGARARLPARRPRAALRLRPARPPDGRLDRQPLVGGRVERAPGGAGARTACDDGGRSAVACGGTCSYCTATPASAALSPLPLTSHLFVAHTRSRAHALPTAASLRR